MTVTPFRTRTRTQPVGEPEPTPESQDIAKLEAYLDDPSMEPWWDQIRASIAELRATTVLAA
jgi:hypothetical protein